MWLKASRVVHQYASSTDKLSAEHQREMERQDCRQLLLFISLRRRSGQCIKA